MNRRWLDGIGVVRAMAVVGVVGAACLTRPVTTADPNLKTNFTSVIHNQSVDKIDLLFMVDNSASMGDKQTLLAAAVPDMITRLVTPNCIDAMGNPLGPSDMMGNCANGKPEFPPVHDMHIGILSSSLGGRGGNECSPADMNPANTNLPSHNDDQGHLLNRGGADEHNVADAQPENFLSWFPPVNANDGKTAPPNPETMVGASGTMGTLIGDFTDMISGVHEHGCGFEAQNEAWYRFLVQPDPFASIQLNGSRASLTGLDQVVLQQRASFLRPDSLLAVIVVTDENEEVVNPLSVSQQGWLYENYPWPNSPLGQNGQAGGAPEGTIECTNNGPNDPNCTSCAFSSVTKDPNFATRCPADPPGGIDGYLDTSDDAINVRFYNQKQRFGVFAGYPISRYFRGLTSPIVPDRAHETDGAGNYVGDQDQFSNCVNPIYAQNLQAAAAVTDPASPALCALTRGPRTVDEVFYAAIVGVPHELLQAKPGDAECPAGTNAADCPQKATFTDADWTLMTGKDPANYDFTGVDFHMLESIAPRAGSNCPPNSADTCDPTNGREYDSQKQNFQFSCIFPFVNAQTGAAQPKDCTQPQFTQACDCVAGSVAQNSPLCQKTGGTYGNTQINGKAYPSVREVTLAHLMATQTAGDQGIVSSLCPIHTSFAGGNATDPLFGYRPAVNAIVDRLKNALNVQCLPEKLQVQSDGTVPCLILVTMPPDTRLQKFCDTVPGLSEPPSDILTRFLDSAVQAWTAAGGTKSGQPDPRTQPICEINQIGAMDTTPYQACVNGQPPSTTTGGGWCYVTGGAAGTCPQQILFTSDQPPSGGSVSLQCIEQTNNVIDGGH